MRAVVLRRAKKFLSVRTKTHITALAVLCRRKAVLYLSVFFFSVHFSFCVAIKKKNEHIKNILARYSHNIFYVNLKLFSHISKEDQIFGNSILLAFLCLAARQHAINLPFCHTKSRDNKPDNYRNMPNQPKNCREFCLFHNWGYFPHSMDLSL